MDQQSVPFGDGIIRDRVATYTQSYGLYTDLGLNSIRAIHVHGRADSSTNGAIIAAELTSEAARDDIDTIIVVAYSKGVPDTLHAVKLLESTHQLSPKVRAVVSVAGIVMGTPIADKHTDMYNLLGGALRIVDCSISHGGEITSLSRKVRTLWLSQNALPKQIEYYSLVAHASRDRIAPGLIVFYDELSVFDPHNDGQVIMADAILPNSTLMGELISDHWDFVLPLHRHPSSLIRKLTSGRDFPREELFRATIKYVMTTLRYPGYAGPF